MTFKKGVVTGWLISMVLVGVLIFPWIAKVRRDSVAGWVHEQVVVTTDALPQGTEVTHDLIAQRGIPNQYVPVSYVRVEDARMIIGKHVRADVAAGEVLRWSVFADRTAHERTEECAVAIRDAVERGDAAPGELAQQHVQAALSDAR